MCEVWTLDARQRRGWLERPSTALMVNSIYLSHLIYVKVSNSEGISVQIKAVKKIKIYLIFICWYFDHKHLGNPDDHNSDNPVFTWVMYTRQTSAWTIKKQRHFESFSQKTWI